MTQPQQNQPNPPFMPRVAQEVGAIAAGINHELILKFGKFGGDRCSLMFAVVSTETMPFDKLQEHNMAPGECYIIAWAMPKDVSEEAETVSLFRIAVDDCIRIELTFEDELAEKFSDMKTKQHSRYELEDPMLLEKIYGSVAEILESLVPLFPSSDNG